VWEIQVGSERGAHLVIILSASMTSWFKKCAGKDKNNSVCYILEDEIIEETHASPLS
jgi:hypothetical protein